MPDNPPISPPEAPGSATSAITLLAIAAFAAQAMVRSTDSLLPQIAADLSVTVGAASAVVTFYLLAHGSVQLIIGPIGDRYGKYLCVAVATAVSTLMVIACGLATGWIIPFALAFVGDVIPYERRQQVIGAFLSGQILGQMFGQAAGGVLGDFFGWRNVFFILAALLAIATVGLWIELWRNPITRQRSAAAPQGRSFIADYVTVLRSPWARTIIVMAFIEFGAMFGAFTYVGADLHLRFDVGFTLVGLFVGFFALGGLAYSLSVKKLVARLGQTGLSLGGGILLALAYVTLAFEPHYWIAPIAIGASGLGFYMLHNTMQTNATQMSPEARGTAVAIFSSALYLGQTAGVAAAGPLFDRFTAVPVFLAAGAILLALGWFLSRQLKRRAEMGI